MQKTSKIKILSSSWRVGFWQNCLTYTFIMCSRHQIKWKEDAKNNKLQSCNIHILNMVKHLQWKDMMDPIVYTLLPMPFNDKRIIFLHTHHHDHENKIEPCNSLENNWSPYSSLIIKTNWRRITTNHDVKHSWQPQAAILHNIYVHRCNLSLSIVIFSSVTTSKDIAL